MTGRTPTRHRTPAAEVETAVLDAAARLLVDGGPGALSIRRIATEAGVAPMSIYNRFESKAGVLDALLIRAFGRLGTITREAEGTDPLDRIRNSARAYRTFALTDRGSYALMFDRTDDEYAPSPAGLEAAATSFGGLVALVRDAQAAGVLVDGDPIELAQRLWATIHGAVSLESRAICFAPSTDQHYDALVDTVLAGLRPEHALAGGRVSR